VRNIEEAGRQHLAAALARTMKHCDVTEWLGDDNKAVKIYWKPVTGAQQTEVEKGKTEVDRVCLTLKVRALDSQGVLVFKQTPLISLKTDFDYDVIKTIVYLMVSDLGQDMEARQDEIEKE